MPLQTPNPRLKNIQQLLFLYYYFSGISPTRKLKPHLALLTARGPSVGLSLGSLALTIPDPTTNKNVCFFDCGACLPRAGPSEGTESKNKETSCLFQRAGEAGGFSLANTLPQKRQCKSCLGIGSGLLSRTAVVRPRTTRPQVARAECPTAKCGQAIKKTTRRDPLAEVKTHKCYQVLFWLFVV